MFTVCIYVCVYVYICIYNWRPEDNLRESVLCFYHMGPRVWVPGCQAWQQMHTLSHLSGSALSDIRLRGPLVSAGAPILGTTFPVQWRGPLIFTDYHSILLSQ